MVLRSMYLYGRNTTDTHVVANKVVHKVSIIFCLLVVLPYPWMFPKISSF